MHGSVMEWCYDFYGPYPENNRTMVNSIGPIRGSYRIVRGGSFVRTHTKVDQLRDLAMRLLTEDLNRFNLFWVYR